MRDATKTWILFFLPRFFMELHYIVTCCIFFLKLVDICYQYKIFLLLFF